jgi:nicotinate phosphoribosyltransferase
VAEGQEAEADLLCVWDETVDDSRPLEIFDPDHTWKRKTVENFTATELLVPIFRGGRQVYELPRLEEIRAHCAEEIEGMWDEVKRFNNPHNYYVDLSQRLWDIKQEMLKNHGTYPTDTK